MTKMAMVTFKKAVSAMKAVSLLLLTVSLVVVSDSSTVVVSGQCYGNGQQAGLASDDVCYDRNGFYYKKYRPSKPQFVQVSQGMLRLKYQTTQEGPFDKWNIVEANLYEDPECTIRVKNQIEELMWQDYVFSDRFLGRFKRAVSKFMEEEKKDDMENCYEDFYGIVGKDGRVRQRLLKVIVGYPNKLQINGPYYYKSRGCYDKNFVEELDTDLLQVDFQYEYSDAVKDLIQLASERDHFDYMNQLPFNPDYFNPVNFYYNKDSFQIDANRWAKFKLEVFARYIKSTLGPLFATLSILLVSSN